MATAAQTSQLNLKLDPVELLVFSGIQQNFLRVFETPSVWVTSDDRVQALKKLFRGNPVKYPFCYLRLSNVAADEEHHSSHPLARKGARVVESEERIRNFRVQILPTAFEIEVQFVSNSYQDTLKFVNRWLFARRLGWLKFQVAYGQLDLGISMDLTSSISIPSRSGSPDEVQEYVLDAMLTVHGYMSESNLIESQQGVPVISLELDAEKAADRTVVWTFGPPSFDHVEFDEPQLRQT